MLINMKFGNIGDIYLCMVNGALLWQGYTFFCVYVYEQEVHRGHILRKNSYVSLYSVSIVGVKNRHCGSICLWEFNTGYSHNVPIVSLCGSSWLIPPPTFHLANLILRE